jgi:hypothetical protein
MSHRYQISLGLAACLMVSGCSARPETNQPSPPSVKEETSTNREKLEQFIAKLKTDIYHKRDQLAELQKHTNSPVLIHPLFRVPSPEDREQKRIVAEIPHLREELARVASKLALLKGANGNVLDYSIQLKFSQDKEIVDLTKQIAQIELVVDYLKKTAGPEDNTGAISDYTEKLRLLQTRLDDRRRILTAEVKTEFAQEDGNPVDRGELEHQKADLQKKLDTLERRLDESDQINECPDGSQQVDALEREIRQEEKDREFLQSRLDDLNAAR